MLIRFVNCRSRFNIDATCKYPRERQKQRPTRCGGFVFNLPGKCSCRTANSIACEFTVPVFQPPSSIMRLPPRQLQPILLFLRNRRNGGTQLPQFRLLVFAPARRIARKSFLSGRNKLAATALPFISDDRRYTPATKLIITVAESSLSRPENSRSF